MLVEALANGVPVLCPDHCGFSDAIDEGCGLKIPINTAHHFIVGLARGMEHLHDNEDLRRKLAKGAIVRARAFSSDQKAATLNRIYQRVVEARKSIEVADICVAKSL